MKRIVKVLAATALMMVLMVTMVSPAFAVGYHCGQNKKDCPEYTPSKSGEIWGWGANEKNENFKWKPVYG